MGKTTKAKSIDDDLSSMFSRSLSINDGKVKKSASLIRRVSKKQSTSDEFDIDSLVQAMSKMKGVGKKVASRKSVRDIRAPQRLVFDASKHRTVKKETASYGDESLDLDENIRSVFSNDNIKIVLRKLNLRRDKKERDFLIDICVFQACTEYVFSDVYPAIRDYSTLKKTVKDFVSALAACSESENQMCGNQNIPRQLLHAFIKRSSLDKLESILFKYGIEKYDLRRRSAMDTYDDVAEMKSTITRTFGLTVLHIVNEQLVKGNKRFKPMCYTPACILQRSTLKWLSDKASELIVDHDMS